MQLLETMKAALQRMIRKEPEHPDDPYALVGAPKKPRTPLRSNAAAAPLHFEESPK
ncbi:MAG: hypothetical protein ACRD4E_04250 [Bryobacteraceae bacterium]